MGSRVLPVGMTVIDAIRALTVGASASAHLAKACAIVSSRLVFIV